MGQPEKFQKIRIALLLMMVANASALAQPGHANTEETTVTVEAGEEDTVENSSLTPPLGGISVIQRNHSNIRSRYYNVVFPSPPPTSKEEYRFSVSTGSNGELSYQATCPTRGTSIGLGVLTGSLAFADNNVRLPKACAEIQKTTEDLIYIKQGRDAAASLGEHYQVVLEKALFHRSLRALAYTNTQLSGQLILKHRLTAQPDNQRFPSLLHEAKREKLEQHIEILQEDAKRLEAIISSTGHQAQGLLASASPRSIALVADRSASGGGATQTEIAPKTVTTTPKPSSAALIAADMALEAVETEPAVQKADTQASAAPTRSAVPAIQDEAEALADSILELIAQSSNSLIFANLAPLLSDQTPPPVTVAQATAPLPEPLQAEPQAAPERLATDMMAEPEYQISLMPEQDVTATQQAIEENLLAQVEQLEPVSSVGGGQLSVEAESELSAPGVETDTNPVTEETAIAAVLESPSQALEAEATEAPQLPAEGDASMLQGTTLAALPQEPATAQPLDQQLLVQVSQDVSKFDKTNLAQATPVENGFRIKLEPVRQPEGAEVPADAITVDAPSDRLQDLVLPSAAEKPEAIAAAPTVAPAATGGGQLDAQVHTHSEETSEVITAAVPYPAQPVLDAAEPSPEPAVKAETLTSPAHQGLDLVAEELSLPKSAAYQAIVEPLEDSEPEVVLAPEPIPMPDKTPASTVVAPRQESVASSTPVATPSDVPTVETVSTPKPDVLTAVNEPETRVLDQTPAEPVAAELPAEPVAVILETADTFETASDGEAAMLQGTQPASLEPETAPVMPPWDEQRLTQVAAEISNFEVAVESQTISADSSFRVELGRMPVGSRREEATDAEQAVEPNLEAEAVVNEASASIGEPQPDIEQSELQSDSLEQESLSDQIVSILDETL